MMDGIGSDGASFAGRHVDEERSLAHVPTIYFASTIRMTMNRTRIAVAGACLIGLSHMAVAQKSPTCALSAVVDPAPAAEAAASSAGVPLFKSLDELLV